MIATPLPRLAGLAAILAVLGTVPAGAQSVPAKTLFGAKQLPSDAPTQSIGFYAKGCLAGAKALPLQGPHWQVVNVPRNRRWGHPATIAFLERLAAGAAGDGWSGLLVGDISQPRGGPMASGHASHQIGLDADIWLTPEPAGGLTPTARNAFQGPSMLRKGTFSVDDRVWTPAHLRLIRRAAEDAKVQRIFVHPGIKKKLCETAGADRAWLNKVRPFYGHDQHFHVRLFCQPGSPGCDGQQSTGTGDGCGDLGYWFNVALKPPKPPKPGAKPPKPTEPLTMAGLPNACRAVLRAPDARGLSPVAAPAAASEAAAPVGGSSPRLPPLGIPRPASRPLP